MSNPIEVDETGEATVAESEAETRREFLKTVAKGAAKGAVIAPAVALLLSPGTPWAQSGGGCGCGGGS